MDDVRDHPERLKDCILQAVVGKKLGAGCFRTVYGLGDDKVLKVETGSQSFCNHHEWTIWQEVEGTKWAKWFAPCLDIDMYGAALIMQRTKPITDREWAAIKSVPNFMADLKPDNWGMLNGKPVCHDYGNHRFFSQGLSNARLVLRRNI